MEKLLKQGYKKITIDGLSYDYYINSNGDIMKVYYNKRGDEVIRQVAISKNINGGLKVNLLIKGVVTTLQVHRLVYEYHIGKIDSDIVFIDGNRSNCNADNLITVNELLRFYNEYIKQKSLIA